MTTPTLRTALRARESGTVVAWLATITHPQISGGLVRLTDYRTDITSRGNTYAAYPFKVQLPHDPGRGLQAKFTLHDINQEMTYWIRKVATPSPKVLLEVVRVSAPDTVEIATPEMVLEGPSGDPSGVISGTLSLVNRGRLQFPYAQFTPADYPGAFA